MKELRYHGRGGQGSVTSAELLAIAAINSNMYAQAMPAFGAERRGAPVMAFNRISNEPILLRTNVYEPDYVMVLDPTVIPSVNVVSGLKSDGILVVNYPGSIADFKQKFQINCRMAIVDASHIAREEIGRPITNITMLGALIKATNLVEFKYLEEAVMIRFGARLGERNINSLKRAFKETIVEE